MLKALGTTTPAPAHKTDLQLLGSKRQQCLREFAAASRWPVTHCGQALGPLILSSCWHAQCEVPVEN